MASSACRVVTGWNPAPFAMQGCEIRRGGIVVQLRKWGTLGGMDGIKRGTRWQRQASMAALSSWTSPRFKRWDGFLTSHLSTPRLCSRITQAGAADTWLFNSSKSTLSQLRHGFNSDFNSFEVQNEKQLCRMNEMTTSLSALMGLSAFICLSEPAYASESRTLNPVYGDVGVVLEIGVQLLYLGALITLLGVGSYLVVRQVLIKRELETAAKMLQDRVRSGDASSLDYFELGAVMLRKKFYQLARKYLNEAINKWDGSEQDLAQVYNALGYSYFSDGKVDQAISQYEKAVKLQPMYVTAYNNLADAYETQNNYAKALKAYEEALQFDPSNKIAAAKREQMKQRVERFQGIP